MKKMVFTIATRRLEVDLEDDFAQYLSDDLFMNNMHLDRDNDISQLLQLYLKSTYKRFKDESHIQTLLNNIKDSN